MVRARDGLAPSTPVMSQADIRLANERSVMSLVASRPGSSSAEIARHTGLGPQTISRILVDLEAEGLVYRGPARRGQRGQPARPIYADPNGAFSIGCEMGWRHLDMVLLDLSGQVLGHHRREYAFPDANTIVGQIADLAQGLADLLSPGQRRRLVGLGLAMPSGIERNVDVLGGGPVQARLWARLDIAGALAVATGLAVTPVNDGNAACWAQFVALPTPRPASFVMLFIGSFVGAGIVSDGMLWERRNGKSANLGSVIVPDGKGGRNFVHLIASMVALEARLRVAGIRVRSGDPLNWDWKAMGRHLDDWIEAAGAAIALTIANSSAVLDLDVAVVDGVMPRPIVDRLAESVRAHNLALPVLTGDRPAIMTGQLGSAAPSRGAALLPLHRRYFSPDWR